MSAWTVSKDHIDLLVSASMLLDPPPDEGDTIGDIMLLKLKGYATWLGRMLWRENFRSVNFRYTEEAEVPEYEFAPVTELKPPPDSDPGAWVYVVQAIHCYDYQTCEHPEWLNSLARKHIVFLERRCQDVLYNFNIRQKYVPAYETMVWPGQNDAPWGWSREDGLPQREGAAT